MTDWKNIPEVGDYSSPTDRPSEYPNNISDPRLKFDEDKVKAYALEAQQTPGHCDKCSKPAMQFALDSKLTDNEDDTFTALPFALRRGCRKHPVRYRMLLPDGNVETIDCWNQRGR